MKLGKVHSGKGFVWIEAWNALWGWTTRTGLVPARQQKQEASESQMTVLLNSLSYSFRSKLCGECWVQTGYHTEFLPGSCPEKAYWAQSAPNQFVINKLICVVLTLSRVFNVWTPLATCCIERVSNHTFHSTCPASSPKSSLPLSHLPCHINDVSC